MPRHIAIVMDGNGRWARERGRTRLAGHRAGGDAAREVVEAAAELGIDVLTLYGFSSENWSRPNGEVTGLFRLLKRFLKKETPGLVRNDIRLRAIGRRDRMPAATLRELKKSEAATADGGRMTLCLAIDYGAQDEIVVAARTLAARAAEGALRPEAIDREALEGHLYTGEMPPVDLLIRTGGEFRISNFLLWQISYAELYFTPLYWPDFGKKGFLEAVAEFGRRERRFGGP
ncbi:MAG: polyprenyl diphosphate synthase [Planctomycetota bacterium]